MPDGEVSLGHFKGFVSILNTAPDDRSEMYNRLKADPELLLKLIKTWPIK